MSTTLYPLSAYYSTTLSPRITSYELIADRILRQLGAPLIDLEVHCETIFEHVAHSIEWYTKYTGWTEEYLIFDSSLYEPGKGLSIDKLINNTPELTYTDSESVSASWDNKLDEMRKVVDVWSFEEGTSTGINTLFTIEQSLAQQTYFSYSLGNYGFDLVTWHMLKEWLDNRRKMLAQDFYFRFDARRQLLQLIPEPRQKQHRFYGLVGCYIERPIKDLINELWVQKYTLALTKISIANVRGKYGGTALFGGGVLNAQDLMTQGIQEKEELERQMVEQTSPDIEPPRFFVG